MSATEVGMRRLSNFVDGKLVPPDEGNYSDVIDPSTGEAYLEAPVSGGVGRGPCRQGGEGRIPVVARHDAVGAQPRSVADRRRHREPRRALVDAECRNTGKPVALTMSEEIPPMVDQIRFFAAAARLLEGRSAGEYMRGTPLTSGASRSGCARR